MPFYGIIGLSLLLFMFALMLIESSIDRRHYFQVAMLKIASAVFGGCLFGAGLAYIATH